MLYPINLEIKDMKITIIGGGDVAYRKCKNFLEFGKSVRVVSPEFIDSFELIKNNVELVYDVYKEEYIKEDNRFSPPHVEWLYLAVGNDNDIHECAKAECRAKRGNMFGFCHFQRDTKYDMCKLVDLTLQTI